MKAFGRTSGNRTHILWFVATYSIRWTMVPHHDTLVLNLQFNFKLLLVPYLERRTDLETVYSAWKADILAFELTAHNKTQDLHSL